MAPSASAVVKTGSCTLAGNLAPLSGEEAPIRRHVGKQSAAGPVESNLLFWVDEATTF